MRTRTITLPELALVAGTRGMLGAGIGLLLAKRLTDEQRRAVGRTLLIVGLVSTVPLALQILRGGGRSSTTDGADGDRLPI